MAINLYGNVSGTYQKPNIDLFEMARKQNNQPVKFCDTEAGKNLPAIKVNISEEGLRALHGSKMKGSVDIQKQMEEMQYISEHQPVESFTNRLSRVMQNSYVQFSESNSDEKLTIQKKETEVSLRLTNFVLSYVLSINLGAKVANFRLTPKENTQKRNRPSYRMQSVNTQPGA
mgnify:CR=1 FL=1